MRNTEEGGFGILDNVVVSWFAFVLDSSPDFPHLAVRAAGSPLFRFPCFVYGCSERMEEFVGEGVHSRSFLISRLESGLEFRGWERVVAAFVTLLGVQPTEIAGLLKKSGYHQQSSITGMVGM